LQVYESMIIVRRDFEEDVLAEFSEGVKNVLQENGAEVLRFFNLGIRDLAYEIAKEKRGRYFLVYFKGGSPAINALSRHLKLTEHAIRHMVVVAEGELPEEVDGEASDLITVAGPFEGRGRGVGRRVGRDFRRPAMKKEEESKGEAEMGKEAESPKEGAGEGKEESGEQPEATSEGKASEQPAEGSEEKEA